MLPLPQRKATGATPPLEAAVQVMLVALGTPEQETESASALTILIEPSKREAATVLAANNFIFMRITLLNLITKQTTAALMVP